MRVIGACAVGGVALSILAGCSQGTRPEQPSRPASLADEEIAERARLVLREDLPDGWRVERRATDATALPDCPILTEAATPASAVVASDVMVRPHATAAGEVLDGEVRAITYVFRRAEQATRFRNALVAPSTRRCFAESVRSDTARKNDGAARVQTPTTFTLPRLPGAQGGGFEMVLEAADPTQRSFGIRAELYGVKAGRGLTFIAFFVVDGDPEPELAKWLVAASRARLAAAVSAAE